MIRFIIAIVVGLALASFAESASADCGCRRPAPTGGKHPVLRRTAWRVFHPFAPIQPPAR